MQNTITVQHKDAAVTITVAKKQLPFGNNFMQDSAKIVQYGGKDEVFAIVTCTADSLEPGRAYCASYSLKGKLLGCSTIN